MFAHLGSAWDFSSFSQWRYALRRQSSSHSGSVFFAEIVRMISSLRPGGIDSDSMSLTKPYLYSRSARISALFAGLAIISALNRERSSAPAGALNVRVLEHEPRLHQLFFVVELGAVQIKQALHVNENLRAVLLENLVAGPRRVEIHFILQARAAAADDFEPQPFFLFLLVCREELLDLGGGVFRYADPNHSSSKSISMRPSRCLPPLLCAPPRTAAKACAAASLPRRPDRPYNRSPPRC